MNKKFATEKPTDYVVGTYYEPALQARLERRHAPYEFKFCEEKDWEKLRAFIRNFWGANHIYVTSPDLLHWQQYNKVEGRYNFVFAEHRETGEVFACVGFIFTSHFDPTIAIRDMWLGLWRARPDAPPGLGGELGRFLVHSVRPRSVGCLGLSKHTVAMIPRLGFELGAMDHRFLLNPDIIDFKLVGAPEEGKAALDPSTQGLTSLRELSADEVRSVVIDGFIPEEITPVKTNDYIYNRFAIHPLLKYRIFEVRQKGKVAGILVTRTVSALGANAMQIVDYMGHDHGWIGLGHALIRLIRESDAEFIDLYSHGIGKDELAASGMIPHRAEDPVIIPVYFDPFEKSSKDMDCGVMVLEGINYRIFKGDSDQDRPNRPMSAPA